MEWIIPGTVISARRENAVQLEQQFSSMFLAGGIVLSQVCSITGLGAETLFSGAALSDHHHQHAQKCASHGAYRGSAVVYQRRTGR